MHPLNETDGSLNLASLAFTASVKRALANDVTVCGEHEPVAYVTEYFLGDGVTTHFLSGRRIHTFHLVQVHHHQRALQRSPDQPRRFGAIRAAAAISALGAGGLVMDGGNGIDGETLLTWLDPVEMGGTLLLEAVGVTLSPGSTGILAGFFLGQETQANCIAGFQVTAQHRHWRGYGAAYDLRSAIGNNLCNQSGQPIYASRQGALP